MYIWQRPSWPDFNWDERALEKPLSETRFKQGQLLGHMKGLGFKLQEQAVLETLTQDVIKSSEIEGERLDAGQVRSSVARRLGMDIGALVPADRDVDGVVEMMLDATHHFNQPLTQERLYDWHAALFPTARSGMKKIVVGNWRDDRDGPMQVISGPIGRENVHYEAPPAEQLSDEMNRFLAWFSAPAEIDQVLRAALAHLWFVTIHPFDDGNGRIARAIADMALAQSENSSKRFYSMSSQIRTERKDYYDAIEQAQKSDMEVTAWLEWFLGCLSRAIDGADETLSAVMAIARFWEAHANQSLNDRQRNIVNRLLDGFVGKLTSSKWAKITKCSQDTALRDITDLMDKGVLVKDDGGGRSTSYSLATPIPGTCLVE